MAHDHPLHNQRAKRIKDGKRRDIREFEPRGEGANVVGAPSYLYRPDEILCPAEAVDLLRDNLRRRGVKSRPGEIDEELDVARVTLPGRGERAEARRLDLLALLDDIRREPGLEGTTVNVVFTAEPAYQGCPDGWAIPSSEKLELSAAEEFDDVPTVAVVDTGYTPDWHPELDDRFLIPPTGKEPLDADPVDGFLDDCAGHSTFICGIIARACPGARFKLFAVLESDGYTDDWKVACAMKAARDVDVINLSLGGYGPPSGADFLTIKKARSFVRDHGKAVVVAAAGNNGSATVGFWPAHLELDLDPGERIVFPVGAASGPHPADREPYSNSPYVLFGRGEWTSTFVDFADAPSSVGSRPTQKYEKWAVWTGTSFATAQVAGEIACRIGASTDARQAARALEAEQAVIPA